MRSCITGLLNTLPSVISFYACPSCYSLCDSQIMVMKKHLEQKVKAGKRKPKLKDIDPQVLPAAWSILRWCVFNCEPSCTSTKYMLRCVASCTAHIEAITSPEEIIKNLGTYSPRVPAIESSLALRSELETVSYDSRCTCSRS